MNPTPQSIDMFAQLVQSLGPVGALVVGFLVWRWMELKGEDKRKPVEVHRCSDAVDEKLSDLAASTKEMTAAVHETARTVRDLALLNTEQHSELRRSIDRIEGKL